MRVVEILMPVVGSVAVIMVVPKATLVASPLLPVALLIVAIVASEESQVSDVMRSWVLPSV